MRESSSVQQSALTGRGVKKEQEMVFKAFANCAGSVSSQQAVLRGTAICVIPASDDSVRWRHYLGRSEKKTHTQNTDPVVQQTRISTLECRSTIATRECHIGTITQKNTI